MVSGPDNSAAHYIGIGIETDNTAWCRARTTSNAQATSSVTIEDTDTWHLIVGAFADVDDRTIYIDGNAGVNNTTSRDPTTATALFSIGSTLESSFGAEFSGLMAYATVWNKALSSVEVASLWNSGAGADPTTVASGNLVAHWPMTGNASPEPDSVGEFDLTVNGTTFSTDNPFTVGGSAGKPTLARFGSVPGVRLGGQTFGRGW